MAPITPLFLSLFTTLAFIPIFRGVALKAHIIDVPDERKVHSFPVPKSGGLAMVLGFCIPILLWLPLDRFVVSVVTGAVILTAAGLADDMYVLGYKAKFLAQISAALIAIFYGGVRITTLGMLLPEGAVLPLIASLLLTLIAIVGITNAINLADGLDGLAGGITLMIFLCLCALAYRVGDAVTMIMGLSMLGALFGFLSFNTYPASVFMGDAGSQFLGFTVIVLSLKITQTGSALSPLLPLLIVGFPIVDTLMVMSERITCGKSPFIADNNHFHHKLLNLGLFHTEAVFIIYVIQSIFVLSAYMFRFHSDWLVLILYLLMSGAIVLLFQLADRYDVRVKRYDLIDRVIKGRLRFLKNKGTMLNLSSASLTYLLPVLLVINCLYAEDLPKPVTFVCLAGAIVLAGLLLIRSAMLIGALRTSLYFVIPAAVFFSQAKPFMLSGVNFTPVYLGACTACLLSAIAMVRLDRRLSHFRSSPMDFLIIVIALCASPILQSIMDARNARVFLIQILIFFYSYEILLNGGRRVKPMVAIGMITSLLVMALKGGFP